LGNKKGGGGTRWTLRGRIHVDDFNLQKREKVRKNLKTSERGTVGLRTKRGDGENLKTLGKFRNDSFC